MAKILLIIPHDRFRDEEYEALTNILKQKGHEVAVGSSHHTEAQGHFGLLVKPDINVSFVEEDDYDGIVFIGGRGIEEYLFEPSIQNLVRRFHYQNKLVAAIGIAVELLAYAGILTGRRVTCDNSIITKIQSAGAYYTGTLVEKDGDIITGSGVDAKDDFATEIAEAIKGDKQKGESLAGITGS